MNLNTFIVLLVIGFIFICLVLASSLVSILLITRKPNDTIRLKNHHSAINNKYILVGFPENFTLNTSELNTRKNFSQCSKKSIIPRILNGKKATPSMYPWIVSLRLIKNQNLYDHFCAGVLVSAKVVITAAHCVVKKKPNEIIAVFGLYNRTDLSHLVMKNSYQISDIIIHENSTENDIAILIVSKFVIFKENIAPICLSNEYHLEEFFDHQVNVIGWGLRVSNEPSELLQQTQLTLLNKSDKNCASYLKQTNKQTLICALQTEKNTNSTDLAKISTICSGDSGGPLFIYHHGKWLLLGIVSFVQTYLSSNNREYLCDPKLASFYTNVIFYYNWINKFINI